MSLSSRRELYPSIGRRAVNETRREGRHSLRIHRSMDLTAGVSSRCPSSDQMPHPAAAMPTATQLPASVAHRVYLEMVLKSKRRVRMVFCMLENEFTGTSRNSTGASVRITGAL